MQTQLLLFIQRAEHKLTSQIRCIDLIISELENDQKCAQWFTMVYIDSSAIPELENNQMCAQWFTMVYNGLLVDG